MTSQAAVRQCKYKRFLNTSTKQNLYASGKTISDVKHNAGNERKNAAFFALILQRELCRAEAHARCMPTIENIAIDIKAQRKRIIQAGT